MRVQLSMRVQLTECPLEVAVQVRRACAAVGGAGNGGRGAGLQTDSTDRQLDVSEAAAKECAPRKGKRCKELARSCRRVQSLHHRVQ